MNELENKDVQDSVPCELEPFDIRTQFKVIVQKLVLIRNEAKFSQEFIADWLKVDRRKIMDLEAGKIFDIILLSEYAKKLDTDILFIAAGEESEYF